MRRTGRLTGAAAAVALHATAIALALQLQPMRSAPTSAKPATVRVSLITPPKAEAPREPPRPRPVKPKAKARQSQPVQPPPVLTSAAQAPTPYVAPPAPPAPIPAGPAVAPPASLPAPALAAAEAPPPVVPPSYNADYLHNPAPVYPSRARRLGEQGKVVLRVLVNSGGTADRVELRTSSGSELLDAAAREAVRRWRFVPARQGDQPVAAWVLIPITFALEG